MDSSPTPLKIIWAGLWRYLVGFASFPVVVHISGLLFEGFRKRLDSKKAADRVVSTQLDPLLKSADELQGKLRSLAVEDFREFRTTAETLALSPDLVSHCSTLYLFAQFWGRLEILRRESFHAELTKNRQGTLLKGLQAGGSRMAEVLFGCVIGLVVGWFVSVIWPLPEPEPVPVSNTTK